MQILYFDCFSGISGDMAIGALLDLGIDEDKFIDELSKLNLDGYTLDIKKVVKSGITGTSFDVTLKCHDNDEYGDQTEQDDNSEHIRHGDHEHQYVAHGRSYKDICGIIERSSLDNAVKEFAVKVFKEIAIAEGIVHGIPFEEVHFHEVGAIDSIIDIVGVSICLKMLGVVGVYSSPIYDGTGFIECQHGVLPVPVPAVTQMLKGSNIPYLSRDIHTELVTPTGLGIIKSLTNNYGVMPAITIKSVGYGMGKRD